MTHDDPSESDHPAVPPGTIDLPLPGGTARVGSGLLSASAPPANGAAAAVDDGGESLGPPRLTGPRRQRVVMVGIAATTILSLLAISLLYYRWAKRPDAEAMIVVWAGDDKAWDGATVTVRGGSLGAPLTYQLRADENLIVRFHVPPGDYKVKVTDKDGHVLGERQSPPQRPLQAGLIWWPFRAPPEALKAGMQ
jgi:hypothetical protein